MDALARVSGRYAVEDFDVAALRAHIEADHSPTPIRLSPLHPLPPGT